MASKRAIARQNTRIQKSIEERLSAIEERQLLIMQALGIEVEKDEDDDTGSAEEEATPVDYEGMSPEDLADLAEGRGILEVIVGTGKNGNILKKDLVIALTEYDAIEAE